MGSVVLETPECRWGRFGETPECRWGRFGETPVSTMLTSTLHRRRALRRTRRIPRILE